MEQKAQVLEILTQAINIAVGAGAYKNSKDVAVINQALEFLTNDYKAPVKEGEGKPDEYLQPVKKAK